MSPPTEVKFPRDLISVPLKYKFPPTEVKFPRDSIFVPLKSKSPPIEYNGFPLLSKNFCKVSQSPNTSNDGI